MAVRVLDVVREARASLVARVDHDEQWEANVRRALGRQAPAPPGPWARSLTFEQ